MAERGPRPAATLARLGAALGRLAAVFRDVLIGASGADAYANYRSHLERHHPELSPLSREVFAAQDLSARWNGVRRCC